MNRLSMYIDYIGSHICFFLYHNLFFNLLNFIRIDELLLRLQLFVVFEVSVQRQC